MTVYEVMGKKKVNFTAQDTGALISGVTFYLAFADDKIEGYGTENVFVSSSKMGGPAPAVGSHVNVIYNKYGKVDSLLVVDNGK